MGFFGAIERFDKKYRMSEPCFEWIVEKRIEIPAGEIAANKELKEENRKLKLLVKKLLEKEIKEVELLEEK